MKILTWILTVIVIGYWALGADVEPITPVPRMQLKPGSILVVDENLNLTFPSGNVALELDENIRVIKWTSHGHTLIIMWDGEELRAMRPPPTPIQFTNIVTATNWSPTNFIVPMPPVPSSNPPPPWLDQGNFDKMLRDWMRRNPNQGVAP